MRFAFVLALLAAVAGCSRIPIIGDGLSRVTNIRGTQTEVEGLRFRSRVGTTSEDKRGFVVTTRGAARSVPVALEAARLRAFDHCLTTVGRTDILWTLPPDRPIDATTLAADGTVSVAGTCVAR